MINLSIAVKVSGSNLNVSNLNEELNLVATDFHYSNDVFKMTDKLSKTFKSDYWEYRLKFKTDQWAQTIINKFIDEIIMERITPLKKISMNFYTEFFIGIEYHKVANPSFHFDKERLRALSEIGFEIDIDTYIV